MKDEVLELPKNNAHDSDIEHEPVLINVRIRRSIYNLRSVNKHF